MDDLLLEVVVFLGTCAVDSVAAQTLCKAGILDALIDLLKAKQEDDEIVLQVVYVFHQLCLHEESRGVIIKGSDVVAYLIGKEITKVNVWILREIDHICPLFTDLMHDKNPEVQRVCDATLDIISSHDELWKERVKSEKFRFHNAQWLEIVGGSSPGLINSNDEYVEDGVNGLVSSPIFDEEYDHYVHDDSDEIFEDHDIPAHFM